MAQQVLVQVTCDVCGSPKDAQTHSLSLDGKNYEVDLCAKDGKALGKATQTFIDHARRVRLGKPATGRRTVHDRQHSAAVREWARAQGYEVSERGRIPAEVEAKYEAAH